MSGHAERCAHSAICNGRPSVEINSAESHSHSCHSNLLLVVVHTALSASECVSVRVRCYVRMTVQCMEAAAATSGAGALLTVSVQCTVTLLCAHTSCDATAVMLLHMSACAQECSAAV